MAKKQTKKDPETETVATTELPVEPTPKKRGRKAKVIEPDATQDAPPASEPAATHAPTPAPATAKAKRTEAASKDVPATPVTEAHARVTCAPNET